MGGPHLQPLSRTENLVLTAIAYFQPITRGELSQLFGKEISRDVIGQLRALNFIAASPRSPAPPTPTSPPTVLVALRPDMEQLEDAGLLGKQKLLAGALPRDLSLRVQLLELNVMQCRIPSWPCDGKRGPKRGNRLARPTPTEASVVPYRLSPCNHIEQNACCYNTCYDAFRIDPRTPSSPCSRSYPKDLRRRGEPN